MSSQVVVTGRIGTLNTKTYGDNKNLVLFSLAIYKHGDPPQTIWMNCKAFDWVANSFLKQGIGVGDEVAILESMIDEDTWTDKNDGTKKSRIVLNVKKIRRLFKPGKDQENYDHSKENPVPKSSHDQIPNLDEIPF